MPRSGRGRWWLLSSTLVLHASISSETLAFNLPAPATQPRSPRAQLRMDAIVDTAFVAAAAALAAGAGLLTYSVSSGEKGLNSFLMKEKDANPFYKKNFQAEKPRPPAWFNLRLPDLPYVEVYGSEPRGRSGSPGGRSSLYEQLDAAIEHEDFEEAARIKARLDAETLGE